MDKLIENYRELFRTLNRLHNTNKGLLLNCDIERLERAREILNNQPSDERRIIPSDESSGLHKHVVNGSAFDATDLWNKALKLSALETNGYWKALRDLEKIGIVKLADMTVD